MHSLIIDLLGPKIVDARNPMVMCTDLDKYIKEVDPVKKSLLLVNKADLLTQRQRCVSFQAQSVPISTMSSNIRRMWTRYFHSQGIQFLFWSANYEKVRQEAISAGSKTQKQQCDEEGHREEEEVEYRPGDEGPASNDEHEQEEESEDDDDEEEEEAKENDAPSQSVEEEEEQEPEGKVEEHESKESTDTWQNEGDLTDEDIDRLAKIHSIDEFLNFLLEFCPPKEGT